LKRKKLIKIKQKEIKMIKKILFGVAATVVGQALYEKNKDAIHKKGEEVKDAIKEEFKEYKENIKTEKEIEEEIRKKAKEQTQKARKEHIGKGVKNIFNKIVGNEEEKKNTDNDDETPPDVPQS